MTVYIHESHDVCIHMFACARTYVRVCVVCVIVYGRVCEYVCLCVCVCMCLCVCVCVYEVIHM